MSSISAGPRHVGQPSFGGCRSALEGLWGVRFIALHIFLSSLNVHFCYTLLKFFFWLKVENCRNRSLFSVHGIRRRVTGSVYGFVAADS
jgi:hypothetical protein